MQQQSQESARASHSWNGRCCCWCLTLARVASGRESDQEDAEDRARQCKGARNLVESKTLAEDRGRGRGAGSSRGRRGGEERRGQQRESREQRGQVGRGGRGQGTKPGASCGGSGGPLPGERSGWDHAEYSSGDEPAVGIAGCRCWSRPRAGGGRRGAGPPRPAARPRRTHLAARPARLPHQNIYVRWASEEVRSREDAFVPVRAEQARTSLSDDPLG